MLFNLPEFKFPHPHADEKIDLSFFPGRQVHPEGRIKSRRIIRDRACGLVWAKGCRRWRKLREKPASIEP